MKPLLYKRTRRGRTQPVPQAVKTHVTKGDQVGGSRGDHRGQEGKVLKVVAKKGRVVVEGINVVKKHKRGTAQAEGGIIEFPAPIHLSNVMLLDPKSGDPTRVRRRVGKDGTVERLGGGAGQQVP